MCPPTVTDGQQALSITYYTHTAHHTVHATFCDKSAKCIGVEWTRQGVPEVFDLTHGVYTNEPQVGWRLWEA